MRERLPDIFSMHAGMRITPARAGKTYWNGTGNPASWDHPRSCGKDFYIFGMQGEKPGSPPLVRERRKQRLSDGRPAGITPARAGKTHPDRPRRQSPQDHPRSCGKDSAARPTAIILLGSPPLVRERPESPLTTDKKSGITPARAGKTV